MARVPTSFLNSYIKTHGTPSAPSAPTPSTPNNKPTPRNSKPPKPKPSKPSSVNKKRHGFLRRTLGAVAGEVFKHSGHFGKHVVRSIVEDEGGGVPINNASSGAVAGLGTGKDEPGVRRKKPSPPIMTFKLFRRASKETKK